MVVWPEDTEDSESDERSTEILVISDAESNIVREDSDHVNDAHDGADVTTPGRRRVQPQQVLGGEDEHTDCVETEERVRVAFTARPHVSWTSNNTTRHRLSNVRQHRRRYEEPVQPASTQSTTSSPAHVDCVFSSKQWPTDI